MHPLRRVACTQLPVHPRHPYAGDLVYTAFSGSHQDAIKKGMTAMETSNSGLWEVPYLPIDPQDLGRSYEAVIRINSQSGKGGIAYIMQSEFGLDLPRPLQIVFSQVIQDMTDATGKEITAEGIWQSFEETYLRPNGRFEFVEHRTVPDTHATERRLMTAKVRDNGTERTIEGTGNGPIDSFVDALTKWLRRLPQGARLSRACGRPRRRCHRGRLCRGQRRQRPEDLGCRHAPQHHRRLAAGRGQHRQSARLNHPRFPGASAAHR